MKLSDIMQLHVIDKQEKTEKSDDRSTDIVIHKSREKSAFRNCRETVSGQCYMKIKEFVLDEKNMTENLKKQLGAFVTLKINGALRGCIGRFISSDPLYQVVRNLHYHLHLRIHGSLLLQKRNMKKRKLR